MTVSQDDFKIEGYGTVAGPPSATEVVAKVRLAADAKEPLTLNASELRVLANLLIP